MDILQLQEMGAFVPTKLVKRTLKVDVPEQAPASTWDDPEVPEFIGQTKESKVDIYIKRLSSADEIAISQAGKEDQPFVMAHRMVRKQTGEPLFESPDQVMQLKGWLLVPILNALQEVAHAIPKKKSRGKTSSGSK